MQYMAEPEVAQLESTALHRPVRGPWSLFHRRQHTPARAEMG